MTIKPPTLPLFIGTFLAVLPLPVADGRQTPPDVEWFIQHDGSREEAHGHHILQCEDGGFLQVGETGFVGSNARILVVKTGADGSLSWKREFGSGNRNMGNSALEVADGYLVCGMLSRNSAILKLDKTDGSTIFQRTHDLGGADAFENIALTPRGILAVGYRQAEDPDSTFFAYGRGHITFLDHTGNLLRGQSVDAHLSQAYRVQETGGGYVISGGTDDALQYGVLKIDADGEVLWSRTFGGSEEDHCFGMDLGADGSIFLAGHTLSGTANWDTYTLKLDSEGNQLWATTRGNPRGFDPTWIHDETWGIKATPDGGCVIAAGTGDEYPYSDCNAGVCSDQWEAYVVKFDAQGNLDWQETYSPGPGEDWAAEDIDLTRDGGAIVAVDNSQFGFLKLAPFHETDDESPGDLDGDGCVDSADLGMLLGAWGSAAGDLDGNGTTDAADIGVLLVEWNPCP